MIMKLSSIILLVILIVIIFSICKVIQIGSIDKWDYVGGGFITSMDALDLHVDKLKTEKLINISLIAGLSLAALIFIYFFFKKKEDRNDPLAIIKDLKDNFIINDEEFKSKITEAKIIESNNKINKNLEREKLKLVSQLRGLKEQGIMSEEEYFEKLKVIDSELNLKYKVNTSL